LPAECGTTADVRPMATAIGSVSIVVPTRNRPRTLEQCLRALERQQLEAEFEIVVVDDGSVDAEAVRVVVGSCECAHLIRLDGVGPAAARNHGASVARGWLVLFTDDDCEPSPGWAARLAAAVGAGVDAAGGTTKNANRASVLAEASQVIADHLVETSTTGSSETFVTSNNLACRADLFAAFPFDERFRAPGGEDREWCFRLAASGFRIELVPGAVVEHRHELRFRDFWGQHVAYGRGAYCFRRRCERPLHREPLVFYSGLLRRAFRRGGLVGLTTCLAQVATAVGFLHAAAIAGRPRAETHPR
jgi:glycosyltransferase involved in cell wall biosynthesis